MFRPSCTPLFALLALVSFGFGGCSGRTMYTAMYSPGRSYYVAPPVKKDTTVEPSAEALLQQVAPVSAPAPAFGGPPEPGFPTSPAAAAPAEAPPAAPDAAAVPGMTPSVPGL
jgi:hypothetical protein